MSSVVALGPWGGNGGEHFDDRATNGGVRSLTIYYGTNILNGFEVAYSNNTTKTHGRTTGTKTTIPFTSGATAADISVTVGQNVIFDDPNNAGVVALGAADSVALPSFPSDTNGDVFWPAKVLGFFGAADAGIDRLGFYVSDSTIV